jgi:hypothetical protein
MPFDVHFNLIYNFMKMFLAEKKQGKKKAFKARGVCKKRLAS